MSDGKRWVQVGTAQVEFDPREWELRGDAFHWERQGSGFLHAWLLVWRRLDGGDFLLEGTIDWESDDDGPNDPLARQNAECEARPAGSSRDQVIEAARRIAAKLRMPADLPDEVRSAMQQVDVIEARAE